jgi:hypothetical protein
MPLLAQAFPDRAPIRIVELPATIAALAREDRP